MSFTSTKVETPEAVSDLWRTPPELYSLLNQEFHFSDFDPASPNPDGLRDYDSLGTEWKGESIFLNPPYSNVEPWLRQSVSESRKGKTLVVLLRVDTSTDWYHDLVAPFAEVRFLRGRVSFVLGKDYTDKKGKLHRKGERTRANFASMLAIFRPKTESV